MKVVCLSLWFKTRFSFMSVNLIYLIRNTNGNAATNSEAIILFLGLLNCFFSAKY